VRERLSRLTPAEIAEKSAAIAEKIAAHPAWKAASTVCLFAAHRAEPDMELLWPAGKRVCYPRMEGNRLEMIAVNGPGDLAASRWGLREPTSAPGVPVSEIDIVLVPGVAFSRDGGRLGRGGGYYDRFLAQPSLKARRIGVCFEAQIVENVPLEDHDERMDEVLTENGWSHTVPPGAP